MKNFLRGKQKTLSITTTVFLTLAALLISTALAPLVSASTPLSQGYRSSSKLSPGSLVSLKENTTDEVLAATVHNVDNILGIVINSRGSLLTVSNGGRDQAQVATSGIVNVLVSDMNGAIQRGDHITASPISKVGMKATANVRVVGVAQGSVVGAKKHTYKDAEGKEQTVMLGQVPVLINVAYFFKEPEKTLVPAALQNIANALAGKKVETLPILLSIGVFILMLVLVSSIAYSMIRSSIISVGRNPMAQSAVYRDLVQMSAIVLTILAVGLAAIYLILARL